MAKKSDLTREMVEAAMAVINGWHFMQHRCPHRNPDRDEAMCATVCEHPDNLMGDDCCMKDGCPLIDPRYFEQKVARS